MGLALRERRLAKERLVAVALWAIAGAIEFSKLTLKSATDRRPKAACEQLMALLFFSRETRGAAADCLYLASCRCRKFKALLPSLLRQWSMQMRRGLGSGGGGAFNSV